EDPTGTSTPPEGTDKTPDYVLDRVSNFGVVKTTTDTIAIAGESVDFNVVLTNNGPSTAKVGHEIDLIELPSGLLITGADITVTSGNATFDGIYDSGTGAFQLVVSDEVNVGATIALTIT